MSRRLVDSGVEWIGKIPEDWKITKLKFIYDDTIAGEVIDKSYWNEGVELLYTCQAIPMMSNFDSFPNRKRTKENDLLLTRNATPYIFIPKINSIYSNVVQKITINKDNNKRFVKYALICGVNNLKVNGDTIPSWNMNIWNNIEVPLISLRKQNKIADYLDRQCSKIDTIVEGNKKEIELLQEYRNIIINKCVKQGINKKIIQSNNIYLNEIGEGFEVIKFGRCVSILSNLVNPIKYLDYPQISPDCIEKNTGKLLNYTNVENSGVISNNHKFSKGTIIYSKVRPVLNKLIISDFDGLCSADMYPISSENNINFIKYTMLSDYFVSQVDLVTRNRVKMPKINQNELSNIVISLPSLEEQNKIVEYLDNVCSKLDKIISYRKQIIEKLEEYKKSLIYEVVTGKKEV